MIKQLLMVLALGVVCGLAVDAAWGHYIGAGVGVFVIVLGLVVIVLRRNYQDLQQLNHELEVRDGAGRGRANEDGSEGEP